jgi:hypothetical protein
LLVGCRVYLATTSSRQFASRTSIGLTQERCLRQCVAWTSDGGSNGGPPQNARRNRPRRSGRNWWKQPASRRQPARWQCSPRAKATVSDSRRDQPGATRPTHPPSRHRHTFLKPGQICFPLFSDPHSPGTRWQGRVKCARLRFSWSLRSACRLVPIRPSRPTGAAARRLSSQA